MAQSLSLAAVFGDHMVLQRKMPLPVWGWGAPGARVNVTLGEHHGSTTVSQVGRWNLTLAAMDVVDRPLTLTVESNGKRLAFTDVLIGEVWIGSGQSNMEWPVLAADNAHEEVAAADHPAIRLFQVPRIVSKTPKDNVDAIWQVCSPTSVSNFSAVAYYFGRHLHKTLGVPVGIIHSSWGGTPAESWVSREGLSLHPETQGIMERFEASLTDFDLRGESHKQYEEWARKWLHKDPGNHAEAKGWADPSHDITQWETMRLPKLWQEAGLDCNGAIWFRREVEISASSAGQDAQLRMGQIDDFDVTYFNGVRVGAIGPDVPNAYARARQYPIPGHLVKAGRNVVAVRVFDQYGGGGVYAGPLDVTTGDGHVHHLEGEWRYRIEHRLERHTEPQPPQPINWDHAWAPSGLFNAMIAPLIPYAMRGVIWYQGESNAERAEQYVPLLQSLIVDWRRNWRQEDFPFLIVQLANFGQVLNEPGHSAWAELREAQQKATTALANVGLAVTIDIGNALDIHPTNKQEVGRRLGLAAERIAYHRNVNDSGPVYESMRIDGDNIRLRFKHSEGLATTKGETLSQFTIAGDDQQFVRADAKIDGNEVVVSNSKITKPVAVRYLWADSPTPGHLTNTTGLPAAPFRTDTWRGVTAGIFKL